MGSVSYYIRVEVAIDDIRKYFYSTEQVLYNITAEVPELASPPLVLETYFVDAEGKTVQKGEIVDFPQTRITEFIANGIFVELSLVEIEQEFRDIMQNCNFTATAVSWQPAETNIMTGVVRLPLVICNEIKENITFQTITDNIIFSSFALNCQMTVFVNITIGGDGIDYKFTINSFLTVDYNFSFNTGTLPQTYNTLEEMLRLAASDWLAANLLVHTASPASVFALLIKNNQASIADHFTILKNYFNLVATEFVTILKDIFTYSDTESFTELAAQEYSELEIAAAMKNAYDYTPLNVITACKDAGIDFGKSFPAVISVYNSSIYTIIDYTCQAGYSYQQIAIVLFTAMHYSLQDIILILQAKNLESQEIVETIVSALNCPVGDIYAVCKTIAVTDQQIAATLFDHCGFSVVAIVDVFTAGAVANAAIAGILQSALGLTLTEILTAFSDKGLSTEELVALLLTDLHTAFADIAAILQEASIPVVDIARVFYETYELSESQVAAIFEELDVALEDFASILLVLFDYTGVEIAEKLLAKGKTLVEICAMLYEQLGFRQEDILKILAECKAVHADIIYTLYTILGITADYEQPGIEPPLAPSNCVGQRMNSGDVVLSWDNVDKAAYYKIFYGTIRIYHYVLTSTHALTILPDFENWLDYQFQVVAVDASGVESDPSATLMLVALSDVPGYIDGTDGYSVVPYNTNDNGPGWGYCEDYFFAITYKQLSGSDVRFLRKNQLVLLDASQVKASEEVSQGFVNDAYDGRMLAYCDGGGISNKMPYFVNNTIKQVLNAYRKKVTIAGTVYNPLDVIPASEEWFVRRWDGGDYSGYCTYWYGTGYVADPLNLAYREWFKIYKIDYIMGIFDNGTCSIAGDLVQDDTKQWQPGQWEDYYFGIKTVLASGEVQLDWYKIISNSSHAITLEREVDTLEQVEYLINIESYRGFTGIFLDDIVDEIYHEGESQSKTDQGSATWIGETWITDNSKEWMPNEWAGWWLKINNVYYRITDNSNTVLNFAGANTSTGAEISYSIIPNYEYTTGKTYAQALASFIAEITRHIENRSCAYYSSSAKVKQGIICLNASYKKLDHYQLFIDALLQQYQHFVMVEIFQATWDMANETTKQFIIADWQVAVKRFTEMKAVSQAGHQPRLVLLGYPCHSQMLLAHIAGGLMLTSYSDKKEDIIGAGNIVLDQLYFDKILSGNKDGLQTFGKPVSGFEDTYQGDENDPYAVCYRKFEGAYVFYNPSRQYQIIEYTFEEDVADYNTGLLYKGGVLYTLYLLPRTACFYFRNTKTGEDAFNFLVKDKPFSYLDWNAGWVIFTLAGKQAIGANSVWIENGYSNNRRFILDGTSKIPVGTSEMLFHAGNGQTSAVKASDPVIENHTGKSSGEFLELESNTVVAVVKIENTLASTELIAGTDYLVEFGDADATLTGKGVWTTFICFLTDQDTQPLAVSLYEQGLDSNGYPQEKQYGEQVEHGLLYRKNNTFGLKTGGVDQENCAVSLVSGVDYYIVPEPVRWKWDYRYKPLGDITETLTMPELEINTNAIMRMDNNESKAIHWGVMHPENAILVVTNHSTTTDSMVNGKKAQYTQKTINKPKVLIYGFSKDVRQENYFPFEISERPENNYRYENQLKRYEQIYYDQVWITGDWDGVIQTGSDRGAWGSLSGILNDPATPINNYWEAIKYFDVVIINDTFVEYCKESISGANEWASWLNEVDYLFIKKYKRNNVNGMLIDRRMGLRAFAWYGGVAPVKNILLNRGSRTFFKTDLTDVTGCLYYGGVSIADLGNEHASIYLKRQEQYIRFSEKCRSDYRIINNTIPGVTDHYDGAAELDKCPVFNVWENDGDFVCCIPKSKAGRMFFQESIQESKLYLKWYDITNTQPGTDNFEKYENLGFANIIFRREPCILFHHRSFYADPVTWGRNSCIDFVNTPLPKSDPEQFCACSLFASFDSYKDYLIAKWIRLPEAKNPDFSENFSIDETHSCYKRWNGYDGNYIAEAGRRNDFGWLANVPRQYLVDSNTVLVDYHFFSASELIDWGTVFSFNTYNEEAADLYKISKHNSGGCIPFLREGTNAPLEGAVSVITKQEDQGLLVITVPFGLAIVHAHITNQTASYKLALVRTEHDENVIYNADIVAIDTSSAGAHTVTINLPRGKDDSNGYVVIYEALDDTWEDDVETGELKRVIANKEVTGGLLSGSGDEIGADIASEFHVEGTIDYNYPMVKLEELAIDEKPYGMLHYEWAYKDYIEEFGIDLTTGLISCQAFYPQGVTNKPPVLIWPGISVEDTHVLIHNQVGTKITFQNLEVSKDDTLYLYYNSFNDMLHIDSEDVGNPLPVPFKKGELCGSDSSLQINFARNQLSHVAYYDKSQYDEEDYV